MSAEDDPNFIKKDREANFCIAAGVGVGAVGVVSSLAMGVVCPLCYFVPPVLIGLGAVEKRKLRKKNKNESSQGSSS